MTNKGILILCLFVCSFGIAIASWDGPVQTIEREETIQEANAEAAAAQNDAVQINHNRIDENRNSIEKRDPHETQNSAIKVFNIPFTCLFISFLCTFLIRT